MTPTAAHGYALADHLRACGARGTLAAGGVHPTFRPTEARRHFDIVVRGEGESVIEDIAAGRICEGVIQGQRIEDLDGLPVLRHELMVDFEKLAGAGRARTSYRLPVMTSRGCPFGCGFCTVTCMFGRKVRRQSPEKIERDIAHHVERGFRHFFFYDDNFVTNRAHVQNLLPRLENLDIRFQAQARADLPWLDRRRRRRDDALLAALRRARCDMLYIGFETLDDQTAAEWKKGYAGQGSLEQRLREDAQILHDSGFWIHAMFALGPEHTPATADDIVRFARRSRMESFQVSVMTPFPGTPLLKKMRPHLVFNRFPADWDYFDGTHCVFNHGRMGIREFQRVVLKAHRKFYSWGGLSLTRFRRMQEHHKGLVDNLLHICRSAKVAHHTMHAWREETRAFLETVRERIAALNRCERCTT